MIEVVVELMIENNHAVRVMEIEEGSNIEALVNMLEYKGEEKDFFFIVNGTNKFKKYVLKDGDQIKIFSAMSGG